MCCFSDLAKKMNIFSRDAAELTKADILITYIFITYYKTTGIILWQNDYIWCNDFDSNEDQIYVGRYYDPLGISKDGFSIHRHLTIKENYGWL